jgi:hypothetical protein
MADDYRGPTADDLLPTQRINEGVLYHEHLTQMFGEQRALAGVPLEIVDAVGGELKSDASGRKKKATIFLTFKGPDGKALPWKLGINATIKKALIARFDSRVVAEWVGWVVLYIDPRVEDKRTGELVRAIRIQNRAPKLVPTFDYAANMAKRIDRARKNRDASGQRAKAPSAPVVELTAEQLAAMADAEAASEPALTDRIAEEMQRAAGASDPGFTAEPEEGQ